MTGFMIAMFAIVDCYLAGSIVVIAKERWHVIDKSDKSIMGLVATFNAVSLAAYIFGFGNAIGVVSAAHYPDWVMPGIYWVVTAMAMINALYLWKMLPSPKCWLAKLWIFVSILTLGAGLFILGAITTPVL